MNKINFERNHAIDLLRIISMLMIIMLHLYTYSNINDYTEMFSIEYVISSIMKSICIVSVNCYVLTSGFFYDKNHLKLKKILNIIFETLFYSIIIYFLLLFMNQINFSVKDLLYVFLPTLTREYWFVTTFLGLYLLSPILNSIIDKLTNKELTYMVLIGFLLFVIYYNFFFFTDNLNFGGATGIVWFVYLYVVGAYFKKYVRKRKIKQSVSAFLIVLLLALLSKAFFIGLYLLTNKNIFLIGAPVFDSVYNSIFGFLTSIFFFNIFSNLKIEIKSNFVYRVFSLFSSSTLAVYLIHDNNYLRGILWNSINFKFSNVFEYLFLIFLIPVLIYIIASVIDLIRKNVFSLIFNNKKVNCKFTKIENQCKLILDKLSDSF